MAKPKTGKGSLGVPLLRQTRPPVLRPVFVSAFLNTVSRILSQTPALCLQFQDLADASQLDLATTAVAYGRLTSLRSLVELASTPALAVWSDRTGRKVAMCLCCVACILEGGGLAMSQSLLPFSIAHIAGGILASHSAIEGSCIIDATDSIGPRAAAFESLFMALGAAVVVGPLLAGELAARNGAAPFVIAAVLGVVALVYVLARMPEYLPAVRRRHEPGTSIMPSVSAFVRLLRQDLRLSCYVCASCLSAAGISAFLSVRTLWARHLFGWGGREIGRVVAVYGITVVAAQFILLPLLLHAMRGREGTLALLCLLVHAGRFAAYSLAQNSSVVFAALVLGTAGNCSVPVLQGLCSRCIDEQDQGLLSTGASALNTASQVFGALAGSQLFAASLRGVGGSSPHLVFSTVCFALAAGCVVVAGLADSFAARKATTSWLQHAEGMHGADANLPAPTARASNLLRKSWMQSDSE